MTTLHSYVLLRFILIFGCYILINTQDIAKLPYCNDKVLHTELILVSTLDGTFTALNPSGDVSWKIDTGPGPLLQSNIHKLELTNNGKWLRIIPSLSGSLYKFDGVTIDPIPISANTLLTSSFRYSDDLVIAGGREIRTYGVLLNSGVQLYECSITGCTNTTDYTDDFDDIIIIERKSHTVRAVEPRTGTESVAQHNIKIPYINCVDINIKTSDFNISAVLPEGLLIATKSEKFAEILWQHKFESPIVAVWRWNGRELVATNLFNPVSKPKNDHTIPSIYVGMHNKQLYVHESPGMQDILQLQQHLNDKHSVIESQSLTQIPWKPIPASSTPAKNIPEESDDSTALSVLYASEYVNGNGYYLYTDEKPVCENNETNSYIPIDENSSGTIWYWWKQAFIVAFTTIMICNVIYNYGLFGFGQRHSLKSTISTSSQISNNTRTSTNSDCESSDILFTSRYTSEFEPISCLGRGGFGVVFQAKKKFDECDYAVKRITLPHKPSAKNRMMREVKALAKLDHSNIVRYYNAWLECPPEGWQQQHDQQWLIDLSMSYIDKSNTSKKDLSLAINVESDSSVIPDRKNNDFEGSSSIVFENSSSTPLQSYTNNSTSNATMEIPVDQHSHSLNIYCERPPLVYLYIQMQLCCKESLKDWLNNNPNRHRSRITEIFEQIINAVEYVHFRGLIHRDLKPSNIFFSLEGQIKVGDFGLVTSIKEYDERRDEITMVLLQESYTNAVGTQLYMSPEQLAGLQYDHKVDIYSLGIIFFELLVSFRTEMERVQVLTDLRKNLYPKDFAGEHPKEYELLNLMLAADPEVRPTASDIWTNYYVEIIG